MQILQKPAEMFSYVASQKQQGKSIGLVPTMGCLHAGHISLILEAKQHCDIVIVSIFVNPTQFGENEDYSKYPKKLAEDKKLLEGLKVNALFQPQVADMYPDQDSNSYVEVPLVTERLCGRFRPGHFRGVATVVLKLFNIIPADLAVFGAKDWQQQILIRKMVKDLNLPIEIRTCPTVREHDGLALSSRNTYLSPDARKKAAAIYQALQKVREYFEQGHNDVSEARAMMEGVLRPEHSAGTEIQYLEFCQAADLAPVDKLQKGDLIALAVVVEGVRLIDNIIL
ncbi:MAG: pantoate--beta-alanine ligase [Candidatus Margulisiibacteriota bacterium]|jgi:pantoate--beta-alanine ligase